MKWGAWGLACAGLIAVGCGAGTRPAATVETDDPASSASETDGEGESTAHDSGASTGADAEPELPGDDLCRPPMARTWQLSPLQLEKTVRQVLPGLPPDALRVPLSPYVSAGEPYRDDVRLLNASPQFVGALLRSSELELERALFEDPTSLHVCAKGSLGEAGCTEALLDAWAPRLLRRPLSTSEREAVLEFAASADDPAEGAVLMLRRLLVHPDLLTRTELGDGTLTEEGFASLTAFELAEAISYALTDGPPDDALREAAEDGSLLEPDVLRGHAERLVATAPQDVIREVSTDPADIYGSMRFLEEWLDTDDIRFAPGDERTLRWLGNEPMMFARHVLYEDTATLATLLNADYTAWSRTLADYYGREERPDAGTIAPTLEERRGLLMQGGWLTAHNGTTARGLFVRERMLCQHIVAPDDVDMDLPGLEDEIEEDEGVDLSPREVRERHLDDPACSQCHAQIDPIGFPFDGFDEEGRTRTDIDGFPIDLNGELVDTPSSDATFTGPQEVVAHLADSADVRACFVQQVYTFVHGRPVIPADTCYLDALAQRFEESGGDVHDLLVEIVTNDSMRLRTPVPEEG